MSKQNLSKKKGNAHKPSKKKRDKTTARKRRKNMEQIDQNRLKRLTEEGNWREVKMCASKKRYSSEERALQVAITCSRERATPLRVYKCPYCGKWHITKKSESDEQK